MNSWTLPRPCPGRAGNAVATVLVVGFHLILFGGWIFATRFASGPEASVQPVVPPTVALLWPVQPRPAIDGVAPSPRAAQVPVRVSSRAEVHPAAPEPPRRLAQDPPAVAPVSAHPEAPASAPRSLLDADASRRAIRAASGELSLPERARRDLQRDAMRESKTALARGIAQAAKPDCLRGEYPNNDMGLLSLPFYLAAEFSGACRR